MTSVEQVINAPALVDARHRVEMIRGHVEDIKVLVVDAYRARDWDVLGYATWADYCREEFGGTIAIPREERGDVVFTLRDAGLSTRAIGAAIGIDDRTVRRDLSGAAFAAPEPDADNEVVDAEIVEEPTPTPEPPRITGTDGKSYSSKEASRKHTGAPVLASEDPADLGPNSAPKGLRKTYREMFIEYVITTRATTEMDASFPPGKVALIAENPEEYEAWIADLRHARRQLSGYIGQMEKIAKAGCQP